MIKVFPEFYNSKTHDWEVYNNANTLHSIAIKYICKRCNSLLLDSNHHIAPCFMHFNLDRQFEWHNLTCNEVILKDIL